MEHNRDPLTAEVIGAAIEVHRTLGPGLFEAVYGECLSWELEQRGLAVSRQVQIPVVYKGVRLDAAYRLDLLVEQKLVVEVKAVERLLPVPAANGSALTGCSLRNLCVPAPLWRRSAVRRGPPAPPA